MRKFLKMSLLIFTIAVLLLILVFFSNEWNRAAFGSSGYIESGSKFGVAIGSTYQDAEQHFLSKGLVGFDIFSNRQLSKTGAKNCHGHEYPDDIELDAFDDDSWRRGIICVASKDGKVIRLSWHYGMFQP